MFHFLSKLACKLWLQKSSAIVLVHLRNVREDPPSLNVSVTSETVDSTANQSNLNSAMNMEESIDVTADHIDWDITVDSAEIDWDIDTVEETEDAGNGLGPYEIVNASEIEHSCTENETLGSDQTPLNKEKDSSHPEVPVSEISWDISVETPQVEVIDDTKLPNKGEENPAYASDTLVQTLGFRENRSQLLDTEYRNKILDDLYEVCIRLSVISI